jgi:hypothetical protein
MDVTNPDSAIQWNRVPELVSVELMLQLYFINGLKVFEVNDEFAHHQVPLPLTFDTGSLITMSPRNLSNSTSNVKEACQRLVNCLNGCFVPRESDLLHKWYANSKRYSNGDGLEATNTQLDPQSRVHTMPYNVLPQDHSEQWFKSMGFILYSYHERTTGQDKLHLSNKLMEQCPTSALN